MGSGAQGTAFPPPVLPSPTMTSTLPSTRRARMRQCLSRVEGRKYLWVRLTNDGERRYYYRRVLRVFENGATKEKDFRKALGPNMDRAVLACKKLDAECEAYLLGETPRRTATLAEFVGRYVERFGNLHPLSAATIK